MASLPPTILPKVGALLRMLASPADGEALNAARALSRALGGVGLDINDLADVVEHPPAPMVLYREAAPVRRPRAPRTSSPGSVELTATRRRQVIDALSRASARGALSDWEAEFCASIIKALQGSRPRLSARQHEVIERLMVKVGGNSAWA
ncbi:hypothetical protein D3272_26180 [Lichenibacterium ramalinae]|uniref:Uncharacterized protein n=1 Tax=Lichenibacterium ramalinae TaxID=2316527 RepID=A0A4Q2R4E8_9HYPH|nr:hypothetical protein D3272_26180 [Lichenibacterium ramalinae]